MTTYLLGVLTGVALMLAVGYAVHRRQEREKRSILRAAYDERTRNERSYIRMVRGERIH